MFEIRKYLLKGITPILGTNPANPDVRTAYITSLAPEENVEEENALTAQQKALRDAEDEAERTLTVFLRNPHNGAICIYDYLLRGFFKAAFAALKSTNGILQPKSKVDQFLFTAPRLIDIRDKNGEPIKTHDGLLERPLRAMTMQGPRIALAASEMINDWQIVVDVNLLPNEKTAKSKAITWEAIEQALDYGQFCGLGQFRNGSYGRFSWERIV